MNSDLNTARVEDSQGLLLPFSPHEVCDQLRLNWWAAAQLHKAGLLSFDPATTEKLDERQEVELRFLGALVAAGCDHAMLTRLLASLEKPYCYRPDRLYYDWSSQFWSLLPTPPEEPEPDQVLDGWISALAEDDDLATLQDIQERAAATIAATAKKSAGEQKPPP
jgi:hypothetical protein